MDNLLTRYGLEANPDKNFSISFVDDFVDCSYRTFLTKFIGIGRKININTSFGNGCHRGLARVNKAVQENREPCKTCPRSCKLGTAQKQEADDVPATDCPVQQAMNAEFYSEFSPEVQTEIISQFADKGKLEEGRAQVAKLARIGPCAMREALFCQQPTGLVLATEERLFGSLDQFKVISIIDLVLAINGKSYVFDYKTRATNPESLKFPIRQLALYVKVLEQKNLPVHALGVIYMVKTEPPKKPTKSRKTGEIKEHKYALTHYFNLEQNRGLYEHTIGQLKEDMVMIRKCLENGIFIRNHSSLLCPCEVADYCNNTALLDRHVSENPIPAYNKPKI